MFILIFHVEHEIISVYIRYICYSVYMALLAIKLM